MDALPNHISFVGTGNMATAIMGGLLAAGFSADQISGGDPSEDARATWASKGVTTLSAQAGDVTEHADLVILAVKPQVMEAVTQSLRGKIKPGAVVMSIAAGVTVQAKAERIIISAQTDQLHMEELVTNQHSLAIWVQQVTSVVGNQK